MRPFRRRGIDRRTFVRSAAAGALGAAIWSPHVEALAPATTLYNGIRLAQPWPPDRRGSRRARSNRAAVPRRSARRHPDRRRPAAVRRRLPDRGDLARRARSTRRLSPGEPDAAADNAVGTPRRVRRAHEDPLESGRDGVQRRRLLRPRRTASSRCGTWAGTRRTPATPFRTTASRGRSRRSTSSPAPTSSPTRCAIRARCGSIRPIPIGRQRFKLAYYNGGHGIARACYLSPDGIHWRERGDSGPSGDRTTFFYNPFRKVWVFSLRNDRLARPTSATGATGSRPTSSPARSGAADQPVSWVAADPVDPRRPEYNVPAELYNLDCVAYESLMLGLFTICRGERDASREAERDLRRLQPRRLSLGAARSRRRFCRCRNSVGDWNWANVQSAGGCCLSSATSCTSMSAAGRACRARNLPGICSTGLATLRRDGFASMDQPRQRTRRRAPPPARPARHVDHAAGAFQRPPSVRQRRRGRTASCASRCSTARDA